MSRVIVIGAGASGMMAALTAAGRGHTVSLFEKNEKPGKKLYITGKGRCNFTNACEPEEFLESVMRNPRFLHSALRAFTPSDMMAFVERMGCPVKVERGKRAFPVSDKASDITACLKKAMEKAGVRLMLNTEISGLLAEEKSILGVRSADGAELRAEHVIVATGGLSYPSTGSDGAGLAFARLLGLKVTKCYPSLVPFTVKEEWVKSLQGLSLKNVALRVGEGKKAFAKQGELLFTHFGISGPLALSASPHFAGFSGELQAAIDLKPALTPELLDKRLIRDFSEQRGKAFKNALGGLFPHSLIPVMISLSGIDPEKRAGEVTKAERLSFGALIKSVPFTVTGLRGYNEAVITRGGVDVSCIDPKTMQAKGFSGLSFCGEVLDLDALTGGFNLQIAWSTGHAAGAGIAF